MLGKLLKYDFKEARPLLLIYALSIGMSLITLVLYLSGAMFSDNIFVMVASSLQFLGTVITLIAVIVGSFAVTVVNFGKQTVGTQGQLMFSLPVTIDQFLMSKIITAAAVVVTAFAYFIGWVFALGAVTDSLKTIALMISSEIVNYAVLYVFLILFGTISTILMYFASVALSGRFAQNRVLGSIVAFIAISFVLQFVLLLILLIAGFVLFAINESTQILVTTNPVILINAAFTFFVVLYAIVAVVFYFITRREFSKKINLP